MKKTIGILILAIVLFGGVALLKNGDSAGFFWQISGEGTKLLPLVTVAALIDSVNPCAFSILVLTIAFLWSLGAARDRMFLVGGTYIAGIFLGYMGIGLGLLQALHLFNTPHFMGKVGAALLIIWGASELLGALFPSFPIKFRIPQAAHGKIGQLMHKATLPAALGLGVLVALCEFPCTGGPYLMVLGLLHDTGTFVRGFGYLIIYNVVFILPLVLILVLASDRGLFQKVEDLKKKYMKSMRVLGSAAMILLGLATLYLGALISWLTTLLKG